MTYPVYLTVIAKALQEKIMPDVNSEYSREVLRVCIDALTGVAFALDEPSKAGRASLASIEALLSAHAEATASADRKLSGPPENMASRGELSAALTRGEAWVAHADWLHDEAKAQVARQLVQWERDLLGEAVRGIAPSSEPRAKAKANAVDSNVTKERVESYLGNRFPQCRPVRLDKFSFASIGKGKTTALFSQQSITELPQDLVIRRDATPDTPRSVTSEFRWMKVLHEAGLSVPKPFLLETDSAIMGAPFMIMERAHGEVAGGYEAYFSPPRSEKLALSLAEQMGRLHSIPIERAPSAAEVGNGAFTLPDLRSTVEAWAKHQHSASVTMAAALRWIAARADRIVDRKAIVHGELQFHNVMSRNEEITAVLDWEMVHVGHPAEDLGYCKPAVETMTTWDKFMAVYLRAGGVPVTPEEIDYFAVDYMMRLLPTAQHVRDEFEAGRQDDIMFAIVGPGFLPKMLHRLSTVLASALSK